jgi:hypothetical protein
MGSTSGPSDYRAEESNNLKGQVKVERQLVGLPWAADCCPWVGKLRTMLPFYHQRQCGAVGVDSSTCPYLKW